VTGGASAATNGAGGAVTAAGGAGSGTGAGGAISVTGGASGAGATGNGGAASVVGGAASSTNGAGGAVTATGGAGSGTGAGGAVTVTGGAGGGGATGNGGAVANVGGAATSTNGDGGASNLTGGVATGTGTGGAITLTTGASAGATGTAGSVTIDAGAATGGTAGTISIGATNAGAITLGRSGQTVNAPGTLTVSNTGLQVYDAGSDHLLTIKTSTDEAGNYNVVIPDLAGNDTLPTLGVNNTFTGINIFPNAGLKIQDGGGDHQLCITTSTDEAASYNVIVPDLAGNDTLVTLATAQTFTGVKTLANGSLMTMGTGSDVAYSGGIVYMSTTAVGNVDAGEDDLISYSLLANSLNANNKGFRVTFYGNTAANANNKTIKIYFDDDQLVTTGAVAANNKDWILTATVVRDGASSQVCIAQGRMNETEVEPDFTDGDSDETGALTIKATGEATATDDIVCECMIVEWLPGG
jgi:hypothetical protein